MEKVSYVYKLSHVSSYSQFSIIILINYIDLKSQLQKTVLCFIVSLIPYNDYNLLC